MTAACQSFLSFIISQSPPKPMFTELVMPSKHLILCRPLLLLPSIFPSIRIFSYKSVLHIRWPKFEFQLQHQSFQWIFMTDFKIDWLDLLAVQGTLKSLLQYHSLKASILCCSAFSMVQLSPPYITTGKTIALIGQTFVDKVVSLLFNILSRFVIAFLPSSKHLLISWLQSPSAVILEPKKINLSLFPLYSLSICHEVMGLDAMILVFFFFF